MAAPPPFESLPFKCEGLGEVDLVSPGNGSFTPGHIRGTNALFVPFAVDFTVSGAAGTSTTTKSKDGPVPSDAIKCTIDTTIRFDGVAYTITGSVVGTVQGQP